MNKVVVITGGTSGIGKELAKIYQNHGDNVFVLSTSAENTVNSFQVDVCNEEQVKKAIETIGSTNGKIDIVINCAGYGLAGALELTPLQDAKRQFDVNFFGIFNINKYAIKYMQKNSKIINISSACALFALPYRGLYSASKAAINIYSESLSMELSNHGIKVISICPGDTKTNFVNNRIKIYNTNEKYGNRIEKSIKKVDGNQDTRMSSEFVATKIYKISLKKRPKIVHIIGNKYKILYFVSKFFPKNLMLHFTRKMFDN